MGVLFTPADVKRFLLPSTAANEDEATREWVEMDVSKSNATDIEKMGSQTTEVQGMLYALTNRIKAWSYTDVQGQPAEITYDNVRLLDTHDFMYLSNKLKELSGMDKSSGLGAETKKA